MNSQNTRTFDPARYELQYAAVASQRSRGNPGIA